MSNRKYIKGDVIIVKKKSCKHSDSCMIDSIFCGKIGDKNCVGNVGVICGVYNITHRYRVNFNKFSNCFFNRRHIRLANKDEIDKHYLMVFKNV